MINEQNVGIKFKNSVTGQAKLEKYEKTLNNIKTLLNNMPADINLKDNSKQISAMTNSLENIDNNIKNITNNMSKFNDGSKETTDNFKKIFTVSNIAVFIKSLDRVYEFLQKNTKASATYLENMNLLDVAYNNNTTSADKLVNRISEMYGLDESWGYRTVGMFKQLSNAMGLADDTGTKLANTLSMLSIDLSSLYNTDTTSAVQKLASALAGQTKPIRSFGADITETTLSQTLLNNNIDLMVRNLSFAEKRLLIVTTILQQTTEAQNDWARTIESVANQERILEEQLQRLNRSLGNVFLPIMKTILPYLNATLMVMVEIINWLAVLVGYNEEDFDFFGDVDESINDLIDSMGVAEESTQKLQRGLRSFDKLNNITTPSASSGDAGGLGVSADILDLFNKTSDDYLSKLTDVEMKATRIRDQIMQWLGFSKEIDSETGKVSFKFDHITSGTVLGALAVGGVIFKGVKSTYSLLKKVGLIKFGGISNLLTNFASLKKLGIIGSTLGVAFSTVDAYDSMYKLADGVIEASDAYSKLGVSIASATASGALLGTLLGPAGTVTGALIGGIGSALITITGAITGYNQKVNEIETHNKVFDNQGMSIETLANKYRDMFAQADIWTEELTNLKNTYEETNKKVQSAKNELILFEDQLKNQNETISEAQLQELNTKFENLKTSTNDATKASIAYEKALIQAYSNTSAESTQSTASQIADIEALRLKQQGYENDYIEQLKKITIERYSGQISQEEYNKKVNELDVAYGKIPDTLNNTSSVIDTFNKKISEINYENADTLNEKLKEIDKQYNNTVDTLNERKNDISSYYDTQIEKQQQIIDNFEKTALWRDLTPAEQEQYNTAMELLNNYKTAQIDAVNNVSDAIAEIQGSYKGFLSTVYTDLAQNGADTSSEFKETIKSIQNSLEDLKNVDMSGFGKNMFDSIIQDINNTPQTKTTLDKLKSIFKEYGIQTSEEFGWAYVDNQKNGKWKRDLENSSRETGKYTNRGYLRGIKEGIEEDGNGGEVLAESSINATRETLGVHSPSTVYEEIGINTVEGYINGIEKMQDELLNVIDKLLNKMQNKFKSVSFSLNISTNVENSFNSILYKLEVFANKFRSGINNLLSSMTSSMNNVTVDNDNKIRYNAMPYIYIPRFQSGLDYVPNDYYLAYLDEGERVLTKQENKEYSSNMFKKNNNNNPTIINLYLDSEHKLASYSLEQLQEIAKDNGVPIRIGG